MANKTFFNRNSVYEMGRGGLALHTDTVKCALLTTLANNGSAANGDKNANSAGRGDASTTWVEAANGAGYTTGGVTVGSQSWARFTDALCLSGTDPSWAALSRTGLLGCHFWDDTATADPIIGQVEFLASQDGDGGLFTLDFPAGSATGGFGYITLTNV